MFEDRALECFVGMDSDHLDEWRHHRDEWRHHRDEWAYSPSKGLYHAVLPDFSSCLEKFVTPTLSRTSEARGNQESSTRCEFVAAALRIGGTTCEFAAAALRIGGTTSEFVSAALRIRAR